MDAIFSRNSVRKFTEEMPSEEQIERLLRAAMAAPSAKNQQPWEFFVVTNKDCLQKLSEATPYSMCVKNAQAAFVLASRRDGIIAPEFRDISCKEEPMRNYEFTVIFDANEEKTAKGMEFVSAALQNAGATIAKQEDMGVRNLAYMIKKQDKGHYYYFEIEADPQSINAMAAEFLLQGEILKHLFVVK